MISFGNLVLGMIATLGAALVFTAAPMAQADPSKYPQFAQQTLPKDIKPEFISIDQLVAELKNKARPVIIDVRSTEEFREAHILGALSAPLAEFREYINSIPKDRLAILY